MADTDWHGMIAVDPEIQGGRPVIKGRRVPVYTLVGGLAGGMTVEEVCYEYGVTEEEVRAALAYAAEVLADERVLQVT